ncbi:MAG: CapA family protein [Deltaproteobacteria bacterium]|nr:CapA family protein [Deltaproteobacteria bacterium]
MRQTLILTGDVNLLNVGDPAIPFARVADVLGKADVVFGNLESCLYDPPEQHSLEEEGFYAGSAAGAALKLGGFHAVGCANNVNYGAEAISASLARLDELGIRHTGAGVDRKAARSPVVLERDGVRFGFLQKTSVFWPSGHEAGEHSPGVATIKGHTAYQPKVSNRPGVSPIIITWADEQDLTMLREEIASLRKQADVVISSYHWGLAEEVLQYQVQIARAAIESGADIVMGHGPHFPLGIEVYRGKPIFYGLGCFSFHTAHRGRVAGDWVGLAARVTLEDGKIQKAACSPVRHNERNETIIRSVKEEMAAMEHLVKLSKKFGAVLDLSGDEVIVWQKV